MIELNRHYDAMWNEALTEFGAGRFERDSLIESSSDTRRGLTLLARPSHEVLESIDALLDGLAPSVGAQYRYPLSDIHITILSIISCYPGFKEDRVPLDQYCSLIAEVVADMPPFEVTFSGLTASPSCLMIRGYPSDRTLARLRDRLRETFAKSDLKQSIDSRYRIETAHLTVLRLARPVAYPDAFVEGIRDLRDIDIGRCQMKEIEFVANDWYQRRDKTRLIERFQLGGTGPV